MKMDYVEQFILQWNHFVFYIILLMGKIIFNVYVDKMSKIITFEPVLNYKAIDYCVHCNQVNFGKFYDSRRLKRKVFICNNCMYKRWQVDDNNEL